MKKILFKLFMITALLALTLSFAGCSKNKDAQYSFEYDSSTTTAAYSEIGEELDFVYEDTSLYIFKDGAWKIETEDSGLFDGVIDEGTYTVDEDGLYSFEGFEYGLDATGRKNGDEFDIYFIDPNGTVAFELHFED